jgi:pSer/pThr/pTyr-binding forkhead associated (FHA) protein
VPTVEVISGPQAGRIYELGDDPVIFGRHRSCDIVMPLKPISRVHVRIERVGERYAIFDLNTPSGTRVNDQPVTPGERRVLVDGDMIRFGGGVLRYRDSPS